jgi:hypothetical protein
MKKCYCAIMPHFVLPSILAFYLGLFSATISAAEPNAAAVVPLGSFGLIQTGGEHCNGQSIDLWKSAESIHGIVNSCAGLIETKKTSIIADQRYDENKGAVDFTVSLSIGTDYLRGGKEVPSDDVWEYHVRIGANALSGTVTMSDRNFPQHKPTIKNLLLKQQRKNLPSFDSLDEWTRWAAGSSSKR